MDLIQYNLKAAGYDVITADDGEEALKKARSSHPALVILDVMLPEVDGLEVCKLLRREPATATVPIIMLTAKASEIDRVLGLELGADDYVTKPFSPRDLMQRDKALLKRSRKTTADATLKAGPFLLERNSLKLFLAGQPVDLTATEFKLLTVLAERRGRVQSRETLLRDVWEYDSLIDTRTVDTHMRRLRDKLGEAARYLDTVRGVGYRFVDKT